MIRWAAAYVATLVVFAAIDLAWITLVMAGLFRRHLGDILLDRPRLGAAAAFYLVYIAGILVLAVAQSQSWKQALAMGAVLGVVAYATYDLTNRATLKPWPLDVAILDIAWGGFMTACAALVGYLVLSWLK
jgi:uncharacterized membrane protein